MATKCLMSVAVAMTVAVLSAKDVTEIIDSCESSTHYNGSTTADKAFNDTDDYWLAGSGSSKNDAWIQVNLKEAYTPTRYSINCKNAADARIPIAFELLGQEADSEDWTVIDIQVNAVYDATTTTKMFEVKTDKSFMKLRLHLSTPKGSAAIPYCITRIRFDDEKPVGLVPYDLVRVAKLNEETPFTISQIAGGDVLGGGVQYLLDEDRSGSIDGDVMTGLWRVQMKSNDHPDIPDPEVVIKIDDNAFNDGAAFLTGYKLEMVAATGCDDRRPDHWDVYVASVENPTDDDWQLVDRVDNFGSSNWISSPYKGQTNRQAIRENLSQLLETRAVKFVFRGALSVAELNVSEIGLMGYIVPPTSEDSKFELISSSLVSNTLNGAVVSVNVFPSAMDASGYRLKAQVVAVDKESGATNGFVRTLQLADDSSAIGNLDFEIAPLGHDSKYLVQMTLVNQDGTTSVGEVLEVETSEGTIPARTGLPAGYTQLEYIESTEHGNQYINTGFSGVGGSFAFALDAIVYNAFAKDDTAHVPDGSLTHWAVVWGCGYNAPGSLTTCTAASGKYSTGTWWPGPGYANLSPAGERSTISTVGAERTMGVGDIYVFADNNGGTARHFSTMRLYSLSFYNSKHTVPDCELVPARENSTGNIGLYDTRYEDGAGRFLANGNTETPFLCGADVPATGPIAIEVQKGAYRGIMTVTLNRGNSTATQIQISYLDEYAEWDDPAWDESGWKVIGAFDENETEKTLTLSIPADKINKYIRIRTAEGEISPAICVADYALPVQGMVIIYR